MTAFTSSILASDISPENNLTAKIDKNHDLGLRIYKANCIACHNDNGDGNTPVGKNLVPRPKDLKNYTAKQIVKILNDAKIPMMSKFKSSLSQNEKEAVAAYIQANFAKK